ncbi:MAG: VWA domain-containing protein [Acidobacteria bacterium]|nr:VWA domain-containing protein [Acidobacteriota bacterium]
MLLACCFVALLSSASGQEQADEVVRVNTDLVQTNVMVFDKQGRFVDGLKREQFEVVVDGKAQPVSFFEQVKAGSVREARLAEGKNQAPASEAATESRGRIIIFFLDDLHLSLESLGRTRAMLTEFVEQEMGDNDQVLIATTSGDLGFLQQFTDSKTMLRATISHLNHKPYNTRDLTRESVPMTEYTALAIERKEDPNIMKFYVEECLKGAPLRYQNVSCEIEIVNRARLVLLQAAQVNASTYGALEKLMRAVSELPGRKLAFFISDGFLLDTGPRNLDPRAKLNQITDAALRAGIVLYTIDARGLISGQQDATNNQAMDANGRMETTLLREIPASQDAMNALAADTGGRALRNQNAFTPWVNKILDETSSYYLLAWRPENEEQTSKDFKNISVRVIDHPEWTARLPRGFLKAKAEAAAKLSDKASSGATLTPQQQLREALTSQAPKREIPTSLSAIYLDTPDHGIVLTASVQINNGGLTFETTDSKPLAAVDVVGLVFDEKGKSAGNFQTRLKISPLNYQSTIYNHRFQLKPGLYQVIVAARDSHSGLVGSAREWVSIPDLSSKRLSLSSLIIGLQTVESGSASNGQAATEQALFSVDHRLARNAPLRYVAFVYNAARSANGNAPDVLIQAQVLSAGKPVITTSWSKAAGATQDAGRIAYGGEIPLRALAAGQYVLQVTAKDQLAGATAVQQTRFTVE